MVKNCKHKKNMRKVIKLKSIIETRKNLIEWSGYNSIKINVYHDRNFNNLLEKETISGDINRIEISFTNLIEKNVLDIKKFREEVLSISVHKNYGNTWSLKRNSFVKGITNYVS